MSYNLLRNKKITGAYFISVVIILIYYLGYLIKGKESDYVLTPSFGVGYYEDGSGKKLGNEIEFRSTLEVSYKINNDDRIGLSFGHISNANLGDKNPGSEIISISYHIPY